jgi:hypothetical protein
MESGTLHFWTTGESYMGLMDDFFRSGEFEKYHLLLGDGNLDRPQKKLAFSYRMKLSGDTRTEEGLSCEFLPDEPEDFNETLYYAIRTAIVSANRKEDRWNNKTMEIREIAKSGYRDIVTLLEYFTVEEIYQRCYKYIIEEEGYTLTTLYDAITQNDQTISGLLMRNGEFAQCGYQDHVSLYPVLVQLGLVEGEDRLDCDAVSISSNMLCGAAAFGLESLHFDLNENYHLTDEQMTELWRLREYHLRHYSSSEKRSVSEGMREFFCYKQAMGTKYGNIMFLKKFFPHIKTCEVSKDFRIDWKSNFVRTSPVYSIPGLLNSIKANDEKEAHNAVIKIQQDFEKYKEVRGRNEINWFYQEYLEGENGVLNCIKTKEVSKGYAREYANLMEYDIKIACSSVQGDIVGGKKSSFEISMDDQSTLRKIARELATTFEEDIQLEFVRVAEGDIRIVQFRTLKGSPQVNFEPQKEELEKAIVIGKTFSKPYYSNNGEEVNTDDILVVEEDCDSEALLGKKALLVENDTNFSHILALSKALNIPSIYGTGKVDLPKDKQVWFSTGYGTGYVKIIGE